MDSSDGSTPKSFKEGMHGMVAFGDDLKAEFYKLLVMLV